LKEEKEKMDKMNHHEKNIYTLVKKTRNALTDTCQYHLDELKYILLGLQGHPETKFEKRKREKEDLAKKEKDKEIEKNKKMEDVKKKAKEEANAIEIELIALFKKYNNVKTGAAREKVVAELNEFKKNYIGEKYTGVNHNRLLYKYYHTLINQLREIENSMTKAQKDGDQIGILQFRDDKFIFNDSSHPTTDNIEDIKKAIQQFRSKMPAKSGGGKTRKNRKNY